MLVPVHPDLDVKERLELVTTRVLNAKLPQREEIDEAIEMAELIVKINEICHTYEEVSDVLTDYADVSQDCIAEISESFERWERWVLAWTGDESVCEWKEFIPNFGSHGDRLAEVYNAKLNAEFFLESLGTSFQWFQYNLQVLKQKVLQRLKNSSEEKGE